MAGPTLRHRENAGRTEPRRGREGHDRRGERGGHPRRARGAFLGTLRERTGHPVPPGSGFHAEFDRDGDRDRQDASRRGCGRRWQDRREGSEREGNPRSLGPLPQGEAHREPDRRPGFHPRPREPPGEPRGPPTNRDEERDRGRDTREARDDAGPPRRYGRFRTRRGVPQTGVPVRPHRIPDVETPPDSTMSVVATPRFEWAQSNDTKLKYRKSMRRPADGGPGS